MEGNTARLFGLYLIFWIVYFGVIYAGLTFFYLKLRGKPPKEEGRVVLKEGRTVSAMAAWEERDRMLRKRFRTIGVILMLVPLLLPFLLRLIG